MRAAATGSLVFQYGRWGLGERIVLTLLHILYQGQHSTAEHRLNLTILLQFW